MKTLQHHLVTKQEEKMLGELNPALFLRHYRLLDLRSIRIRTRSRCIGQVVALDNNKVESCTRTGTAIFFCPVQSVATGGIYSHSRQLSIRHRLCWANGEVALKLHCVVDILFIFSHLEGHVSKNESIRYLPGFGPVVTQECSHCGRNTTWGANMSAPIHDMEWVTSILADVQSMKDRYPAFSRISAVLTTISEELPDVPLFLSLHNLCATLKCTSPSAVIFRSAVINAGYRISGTHINPLGLKTDAPMT
ncbi:putative tRNA (guanine(26)-N(2))-dimethyltransferase 2 [Sesamum alatum]|uniref:tRNA (guanine(26)-N(2))-dimethyltransferase n=1 Tax=Sesamum alatum TaxID=300844 RepID=A0AAE1Y9N1_9LAMI|nr:putative tRNA (guanine(26)-N(2))-dimethyltransferase 2 [Sesamum alatum]